MTVQFNLLPDIKIQYLKAKRQQHIITFLSVVASAVAVAVLLILITTVYVVQKKTISDLKNNINTKSSQLKSVPNLNEILTVQNQLKALPALYEGEPVSSRLYNYLSQVTPNNVSISALSADFAKNTITLTGSGTNLTAVNTYVDTLKFTKYTTSSNTKPSFAFSNVVLSSFSDSSTGASYSISLNFDPTIFTEQQTPTLSIPSGTIPTRSALSQQTPLFQSASGGQ